MFLRLETARISLKCVPCCTVISRLAGTHLAYLVLLLVAPGVREETWCCSMLRLWSCRLSTSLLSFSPGTSAHTGSVRMLTIEPTVTDLV